MQRGSSVIDKDNKQNTLYWLWLTNKSGITEKELDGIIHYYGSVREVYEASEYEIALSDKAIAALHNKSLVKAEAIYNETERIGGYIITVDDAEYPMLLRNIPKLPYVLYCKGQHMDWKNILTIGVVGTRRYSSYGKQAAEHICSGLAKGGAVIVSGMARGIDSIAAWSALNNGGKTVAVLGSGLDVVYPPENVNLYNMIGFNGVVMTEFPPHTKPYGSNFPRRNRIIAGLSYGVLAVQAPEKSGALITAGQAVDFGRDVYAVPASIFEIESAGTNRIIQQGAKAVMNGSDILEEYPYFELDGNNDTADAFKRGHKERFSDASVSNERRLREDKLTGMSHDDLKLIRFLAGGDKHIDDICRYMEKEIHEISAKMVMLEIMGYAVKLENNEFTLNQNIVE